MSSTPEKNTPAESDQTNYMSPKEDAVIIGALVAAAVTELTVGAKTYGKMHASTVERGPNATTFQKITDNMADIGGAFAAASLSAVLVLGAGALVFKKIKPSQNVQSGTAPKKLKL